MKLLGMALMAVFAFSAVAAVAAQAEVEFHSEAEKTFLFGEQKTENVFTTTAGTVKCKKASFASNGAETATGGSGTNWTKPDAKVIPTYSECTAFGQKAEVVVTSCHYYFTRHTIAGNKTWHTVIEKTVEPCIIHVFVPSGNCRLTIFAQEPGKSGVKMTNEGEKSARAILVTSEVSEIAYTVTGPGTICGTEGEHKDGKYSGSVLEKGYKDAAHTEQVGLWQE